jgi:hypothetical protein
MTIATRRKPPKNRCRTPWELEKRRGIWIEPCRGAGRLTGDPSTEKKDKNQKAEIMKRRRRSREQEPNTGELELPRATPVADRDRL